MISWEVRKIIDSNIPIFGGYVSVPLEGIGHLGFCVKAKAGPKATGIFHFSAKVGGSMHLVYLAVDESTRTGHVWQGDES